MKTALADRTDYISRPKLPYPNAATRKQLLDRFLDLLLMVALGTGAAACFLVILALA